MTHRGSGVFSLNGHGAVAIPKIGVNDILKGFAPVSLAIEGRFSPRFSLPDVLISPFDRPNCGPDLHFSWREKREPAREDSRC
jgi:hypothetical protein